MRDAIPLRVEINLQKEPSARVLPALATLQQLGVKPAPVTLLQVKRSQLRELVGVLLQEPVFYWVSKPVASLPWNGINLPGVSEHLAEKATPAAAPLATKSPVSPELPNDDYTPMTVDGSEHFLAITLPSRSSVVHEPALEFLRSNRFILDPVSRKWWLRDRHKVLNILATHRVELSERFRAKFTTNFKKNTENIQTAKISAEVREKNEGYNVSLGLQAGRATEAQIHEAVATGRCYIEDGKSIYLIDRARLIQLEAAHSALANEPGAGRAGRHHSVPRSRAPEVNDLLENLAPHFQAPETWRERSAALHQLSTLIPAPIPASFNAQLRPYQQLGTAWLWYLYRHDLGGILADEMGLGKTLQALALIAAATASRHPSSVRKPNLVLAPASLIENWRRESTRFAPDLRLFVHHGSHRLLRDDFAAHDLVLTSYGTLARDTELFGEATFDIILADEAQHLKNRRTQASQSLRSLHGAGRFLLTGTPLENSLDDLRSLFEFFMPGFLAQLPAGLKHEERNFYDERIRVQTAPYILRRTKTSVAPELPKKIEQVVYCEPTAAQAARYRSFQEQSERELTGLAAQGASENKLRLATLTQLLRLRQLCCDPRLIATQASADESAKLDAFRELLAESLDEGHRMLVCSQFTSLLALLRAELEEQGVEFCYLDGSMTLKARQAQVDRFQGEDTISVFLISLKAGGIGLNLTGANIVVHYDPWWNPAAEAQATDRAHRLGQTRIVTCYRLICSGTVEEKVLALQEKKRALLANVFETSDAAAAQLNLNDLRELLR